MGDILIFGLISGAVIALGSLGLSLIFGQFRFLNFAYGELLTLGAYLYLVIGGGWLGVGLTAVLLGLIGLAIYMVVFKPLTMRGSIMMTVGSMGLGFALQNTIISVWGTQVTSITIPVLPWQWGPLQPLHVTICVTVAAIVGALATLLYGTRTGRQLRAAADNRTLAAVSGVDLRRVALLTWGLGSAMAGVAGVLLAAYGELTPTMGFMTLFPIIAAVLIAGGSNPFGAAGGGFVIGIGSEVAAVYIGSAFKPAMAIALLAAALFVSTVATRKVRV